MRRELLPAHLARMHWAIEPIFGNHAAAGLVRRGAGVGMSEEELREIRATRDGRSARRQTTSGARGSIAVIAVEGIIFAKAGLLVDFCGGVSCQQISSLLRDAVSDPGVEQVLLSFDSPGGSVHGVHELAIEICEARVQKPIIGVANHTAASAAYWLLSQCSEVYVSPSGSVGSVGVYVAHEDISEAQEREGIRTTLISAGKYKTEGSPTAPLSLEAKDYLQSQVNEHYRAFVGAVARGRGVPLEKVKAGFGQGRMVQASAALAEKMVDGVLSFDDLVRSMQAKPRTTRGRTGASASINASADPAAIARKAAARRREIDLLAL